MTMFSDDYRFLAEQPSSLLLHRGELPSTSPVDGRLIGWYPVANEEEVRDAAARLQAAARDWAQTPLASRLRALARLREVLARNAGPLEQILCRETGKPVVETCGAEILPSLRMLAWLERNAARALAPERLSRRRMQEWNPYGVVGLLTPWNYPLFLSLSSIAAALVAGNTVLWKPSELALASSHLLYAAFIEAGLESVVRMVTGDASVGEIVARAGCDKYVLIGGAAMGREVLQELGRQLRPAVAELSGCDAMIVCADADLETAARSAVWGRLVGAGQTCMAPKRIFVHGALYAPFLEAVSDHLRSLHMGDPTDPRTEVGPLRTEALRQTALAAIQEARDKGAWLIRGGQPRAGPGHYLEPALLADCRDEMRVMTEDLFAPILAVSPVAHDEEAVARANRSRAALTASVWTRSRGRGRSLARRLHGGIVSVNDLLVAGADPAVPFGGCGDSGYGRTRGVAGLREMVQPRVMDSGPPSWLPRHHLYPYRDGTVEILRGLQSLGALPGAEKWRAVRELLAGMSRYKRGIDP